MVWPLFLLIFIASLLDYVWFRPKISESAHSFWIKIQNALIIIYVHWFSFQLIPLLHFAGHRNWNITAKMITLKIRTFMLMNFFGKKKLNRIVDDTANEHKLKTWIRQSWGRFVWSGEHTREKKKNDGNQIFPDECATANRTMFKLLKTKTDRCWTTPNRFYIWFAARPVRRGSKGFFLFYFLLDIFFSLHFYSLTF